MFLGHSVKEAVRIGVNRGLLSNEAGNGSASIVHGAAKTKNPIDQGLFAMVDPFIDTIVVCTMTGLCIIVTEVYMKIDPAIGLTLTSTALTTEAFNTSLPYFGGIVVSFCSFLFGYSTIIGWFYIGEQCLKYLFGNKINAFYKIGFLTLVFIGSILQENNLPALWDIAVISMGLMVVPNLIAVLFLSFTVKDEVNKYFRTILK